MKPRSSSGAIIHTPPSSRPPRGSDTRPRKVIKRTRRAPPSPIPFAQGRGARELFRRNSVNERDGDDDDVLILKRDRFLCEKHEEFPSESDLGIWDEKETPTRSPGSLSSHSDDEEERSKTHYDSPRTYDDIQFDELLAASWGLVVPPDASRRLSVQNAREIWLDKMNQALLKGDHAKVGELLLVHREEDQVCNEQMDCMVRLVCIRGDWRTLCVLLFLARAGQICERELLHTSRDLVVCNSTNSSERIMVSKKQVCAQLLDAFFQKQCLMGGVSSPVPTEIPQFTNLDLIRFCEDDDVISLTLSYVQYEMLGGRPQDFCELETEAHVIPSSMTLPINNPSSSGNKSDRKENGELHELRREAKIAESYDTPNDLHGELLTEEEKDGLKLDPVDFLNTRVIPHCLNQRFATILEMTHLCSATHCSMFLTELGSGRLTS